MAKWTPSPNFLPGNTEMGSDLEDSHQLTGSVTISGSLAVNGVNITGGGGGGGGSPGGVGNSVQVNDGAGGFEGNSNLKYIPGGGGADALRLTGSVQMTGSIELSGAINQTGSINMYGWGFGPGNPADITIVPGHSPDGPWVPTAITIGNLAVGSPNPGDYSQVINYGSLSCSHGITASSFVGDGSGLTNLPGGGGGSPGGSQYDVQVNDGAGGFAGDAGLIYEDLSSGGDPGTLYFPTASTYDADHTIKAWDGSGGGSARNINVIMADDAGTNALFYKNSSGAQVALIDSLGRISGSTIFAGALTSSGGLNGNGDVASANANLVISVLRTGAAPEGSYSGSIDLVMGDAQAGDAVHFKTFGSASVANINHNGKLSLNGDISMDGANITANDAALQCASISQINSIAAKSGENLQVTFDADKDFEIGFLGGSTGIKIFGDGEEVQGSILSSSAGGIDIDLYTGSISNVATLSASFVTTTKFTDSISAATNASCSFYNVFDYTLGNTLTLTALNPVAGASYLFFLRQGGGGSNVVTFSGFKWPGGTAPTLSTAVGAVDIVSGISDGTDIYADTTKNFS